MKKKLPLRYMKGKIDDLYHMSSTKNIFKCTVLNTIEKGKFIFGLYISFLQK